MVQSVYSSWADERRRALVNAFYAMTEAIIAYLPHTSRLCLRATCRVLHHTVDSLFVRSLTLTPTGPLCPSGRVPIPCLAARPDLHPFVHSLDMSPLTSSLSSLNEAAIAALPPFASLPGLRILRSSAEKALPRLETLPTVIRVFQPTNTNPGGPSTPWRLHARPLPRCERLVLLVLHSHPRDFWSAQLSPRFWNFPATLREVVLHVRAHPMPEKQMMPYRAPPDNGFEIWAGLLGLLRVLAASDVPRVVLVDAEEWDPAWISDINPESRGFEEAWKGMCVRAMVRGGMGMEVVVARVRAEERFVFLSEESYRAQVGKRAWRAETAAMLSDLEEGEV